LNNKFERADYIPLILATLVVVFDQLTKYWIMISFRLHEYKVIVPDFFNLVHITNTGAAFGFLAGDKNWLRLVFFVTVNIIAMAVMAIAYRHLKKQGRIFVYAIGLIAGGAIGNLIDRLRFGSVVDFLDFYIGTHHWPAFNVADSAISTGVGLFLLGTIIQHFKEKSKVPIDGEL
jgi:signal peptidase II